MAERPLDTQPKMAAGSLCTVSFVLLCAAGVVLAIALQGQTPLQSKDSANMGSGDAVGRESEVFCYEGVQTLSDEHVGEVNCFTVSGGEFTRVTGQDDDPTLADIETRSGHVIPGLWDGHGHVMQYGEFLHSVDLFGSDSPDEVRRRIVEYVAAHPEAGTKDNWIRGVGWDQMALGGMPTADMLSADSRLAGKYILLDRVDVHCNWASQAVLDLLQELPDGVPGGEIVREPGLGVFCDNAMDLVLAHWPKPGSEKKLEYLRSAAASLHSFGLVGVHDASVWPEHVALYEKLIAQDTEQGLTRQDGQEKSVSNVPAPWTLRVYAMLECPERNTFCAEHARQITPESNGGFLSVQSVKLFGDGALGSWGSAMLEPYSDRPDWKGGLLVNASTMAKVTKQWAEHGFQVNIHAIGDEANRVALKAMEAALKHVCDGEALAMCQAKRRFRIEHAQIIHSDDQKRMHKLGVIPSIQPTHATSDMKYAELRLGPERTASEAYRMRSFLDVGLVLGSDFPVEPPNPFEGLYAAITRKSPHTGRGADGSENGWHIEEALTLEQAVDGFTKAAARGAFLEGKAGVIQKGAYADWVVLDKPLAEYNVEELRTLKVKETWIGGKRVYERP